ncbi:hypothetical protein NEF87_004346 [Candidatus Lokiarchaeum ossiferum]|uniref:Polysaccharide biosynthesis protein C-terminal domain-containing protein n=1 Tax=Candidatus Lokiarchaeum ossiferum TaxID=2951803 RepID=A0ABY6HZQ5_9ARCH|nr:hypothetical protein NEF87_004346 [Candidatus Lokiarchaeum sp. B-35]
MAAKDSILILISKYFSQIISVGIFFFAVKKFSPESFAFLSIAVSIFAFFNFFSDLSFQTAHLKKTSEQKLETNIYFSTYLILKLVLIIVTSIGIYFVLDYQIENEIISNNPIQIQILEIYFISSFLQSLNFVFSTTLQAQLKIVKMQIPTFINSLILGTFKAYAIFIAESFFLYCLSIIIANFISLLFYIYYLKDIKLTKPSKSLLKDYLKISIPLLIPSLISISIQNLGPFIFLQHYDESILGVYYVIQNILRILFLIQQSLSSLFLPSFSSLIAKNNHEQLKFKVQLFERYMMIFWGLMLIGAFILAPLFIKVFFGEFYYIHGTKFLLFSIFTLFSWGLWNPYGTILIASGRNKLVLVFGLVGLFFTIISWLFLIPTLGLIGLSIGPNLGYIVSIPVGRYYVNKDFNFGNISKISTQLIFINLSFLAISIIINNLIGENIVLLIILTIFTVIGYFLVLIFMKLVNKNDYLFVMETINPKKFMKYVISNAK